MATNRVKLEDVVEEAKTALEAGNADRAITLCNHVFKYFPRCLEASRVLAEAYTEKRLLDEADQLLAFVLSADPQDVLGYADRGFIAFERGNIDDTIMYYERAIELDSSIEKLRDELLNLYREKAAGSRARIRITKAGLANGRLQQGFYAQAIEEYSSILREVPNRLDIQVGLLEAYWRNKDYPRAEKLALELLENHPNLVKANLILWHIYGFRRHQDNAAQYIEKAHALDPLSLLAERMFDDPVSSNDVMNYISMLGTPNVPPPPVSSTPAGQLVPEWAGNRVTTDRVLGLRPENAEPESPAETNLGIDIFALLAATEAAVAEQKQDAADKQDRQDALAELDQFRSSVGGTSDVDSVFDFFEEVKPDQTVAGQKSTPATSGAFDLDFSGAAADDFDLFNQVEQNKTTDNSFAPSANVTEPDLFADIFGDSDDNSSNANSLPVFDLDAISGAANDAQNAEKPPVFDLFADDASTKDSSSSLDPAQFDLFSAEPAGKSAGETEPAFDLFADTPPKADSEEQPAPFDLFADTPPKADLGQADPPVFDFFDDSANKPAEESFPVFDLEQFNSSADADQSAEQPFFFDAPTNLPTDETALARPPAAERFDIPDLSDLAAPPRANPSANEELPDFLAQTLNDEPGAKPWVDNSPEYFTDSALPDFLADQLQQETPAFGLANFSGEPTTPPDFAPDDFSGESVRTPEPGTFSMTDFLSSVDNAPAAIESGSPAQFSELSPWLVGAPLPRLEEELEAQAPAQLTNFELAPWLVGAPLPQLEVASPALPDLPDFLTDISGVTSEAPSSDFVLPEIPDFPADLAQPASTDFELPPLPDFASREQAQASLQLPEIPDFSAFSAENSVATTNSGLADLPPLPDLDLAENNNLDLSGLAFLPDLPEPLDADSGSTAANDFELPALPDLVADDADLSGLSSLPPLPDLPELETETTAQPIPDFELPPLPELVAAENSSPNLDDFELPPLPELTELTASPASAAELPPLPDFLTEHVPAEFSLELPPVEETGLPDLPPLPDFVELADSPATVEEAAILTNSPTYALESDLPDFAELAPATAATLPNSLSENSSSEAVLSESAAEEAHNATYLNFLVEQDASEVSPDNNVVSADETLDFQRWTPAGKPARHAFHKRDERGPLPDFVLAANQATGQVQPSQLDVKDLSADSLTSSSRLTGDENMQSGPLPQQHQEQENDAMPIKRGPQDDNDVFDWEREELPDYLQAFAMDEEEVTRSGLAAPNPAVSDVNTGPARIRPRDDTSPSGDLPDWLNPTGGMSGRSVRGEQVDLTGSPRPGSGSLPNWLDQTDLDSPGPKAGMLPAIGGQDDLGLSDLQPFGLAEDGFGGPPPVRPTANAGRAGSGVPATSPTPNLPSFGGMDDMNDLQPFNFDDPAGGFGNAAPSRPVAPPPTAPAARPTAPQPATPPTPNLPSFGGMDDMSDLQPFNFDDPAGSFGGGIPATPPAAPSRPAAPPPVAPTPPQPAAAPAFGLDDDFGGEFGDLLPFSFDDPAGGAGAAPSRATPTPPTPQPPAARPATPPQPTAPALGNFGAPTPAMPFGGVGGNLFDDDLGGGDGLQPFSLGLDDGPGARPAPPNPSTPSRPAPSLPQDSAPFGLPGRVAGGMPNQPAPSPFGAPGFDIGGGMDDMNDLQPFNFGEDVFGANDTTGSRGAPPGLGFGAIDPVDTLSPRPFHGNRSRQPEPRVEGEPGQDAPLRPFGWLKQIEEQRQKQTSAEKPDESTFLKLQRRKHEAEVKQGDIPGQMFKPQTSPLPGELDFNMLNVTEGGNIQPVQARPGTQNLQTPPSQPSLRDLHQQTGPYTRPTPPTRPSTTPKPTQPEDVFDLGDLGLTTDLSDEAFNKSLDQTLPTPQPGLGLDDVAPYRTPVQPIEGIGIDPFDITNIPGEGHPGEDVAFPIETPQVFQLGVNRPAVEPEAFSPEFDPRPASNQPDVFEPDFGNDVFNAQNPFENIPGLTDPDVPLGNGSTKPVTPDFAVNDLTDYPDLDFSLPTQPTQTKPGKPELPDFDFGMPSQPTQTKPELPDFDFGLPNQPTQTRPGKPELPDFAVEPIFDAVVQPVEPTFNPATIPVVEPPVRKVEPPVVPTTPVRPTVPTQPTTQHGLRAGGTGSLLNRGGTTGNLTATLQLANRFFEQQDDNQAIIYFANAIKQAEGETLDKIIVRLREIATIPGKTPRYHRALGDAYKKQGHFQAALAEYSKALAPLKK